jgi:predicted NBD/HSP70 family sugar kinase
MQASGEAMAAAAEEERQGVGPLLQPYAEALRPLRQQVFEQIRAAGTLPRVQIAKELGVSPASVSAVAAELLEAGLIEEVAAARDGDASRGRPPVALGVRPGARHVVGMKLSDREHTAVLVDFAGGRIASESVPHRPGERELDALLRAADTLLDRVAEKAGLARGAIAAVGLGVPGFVDAAAGRVHWSPLLRERDVPLEAAVAARLGLPVHVDNDANLVALAELWFGAGRALSDFAVVTIEHGVGMGLVVNHRLYRGARGLGTELGHMKVHLDGALCRCGQRGCLEAYVADYALAREATTALDWTMREGQPMGVLLESLFDHAKAGNGAARAIFRRAGRYLAVGLANVVNLFDPDLIILSGERMRYDYLYAADTLAELSSLVLPANRPPPPIEVHAWGDLLWAHGAAALALSAVTEGILGANAGKEAS